MYLTTTSSVFLAIIILVFLTDVYIVPKIVEGLKTRSLLAKKSQECTDKELKSMDEEDVLFRNQVLKTLENFDIKKRFPIESLVSVVAFCLNYILGNSETIIILGFFVVYSLINEYLGAWLSGIIATGLQGSKQILLAGFQNERHRILAKSTTFRSWFAMCMASFAVTFNVTEIVHSKNILADGDASKDSLNKMQKIIRNMFNLEKKLSKSLSWQSKFDSLYDK